MPTPVGGGLACRLLVSTVLLWPGLVRAELADNTAMIPATEIVALEQLLQGGEAGESRSRVSKRRAFKNVARNGLALVAQYPDAPNRFRALGLVLEGQRRLLAMEGNDRTRQALIEVCEMLRIAPDAYVQERLEADLLLSDWDLSARDATRAERAEALSDLLDRYQGTDAEARSLLMGALIARKLNARPLERRILASLDDKFADDLAVIAFRRKFLMANRLDLVFRGAFERVDGTKLVFPDDIRGHLALVIFWSQHQPGIETFLAATQADLMAAPVEVAVFSFNVDQLPDGGQAFLEAQGLDWTVLKLPGGRHSPVYEAYAQYDPAMLLVNEYGFTVVEFDHRQQLAVPKSTARFSEERYSAVLQSIFIGDFLVNPAHQASFVPAPLRYRLSREEALATYRKAAALLEARIAEGRTQEVWRMRDDRMIALLGMWNLAIEPMYLAAAVREAQITLAADLPVEAQVVARFCLARQDLRSGAGAPAAVVTAFLEACGGETAPAAAVAAAAVLALDARSRELYRTYRDRFLLAHATNPRFYAFTAFLNDRHIQHRLLYPNHTGKERDSRGYIVGFGHTWPTNALPSIELQNLDGTAFRMPEETHGKLTYLLFVEPPAEGGTNNWPMVRDSLGRLHRPDTSGVHLVVDYAAQMTRAHVNQDIAFVVAFLTDDAEQVRYLMQTNGWSCHPVMVPGGLQNPMVNQLGIFAADLYANVLLLRRDGSVAWRTSGFPYLDEFGFPFAFLLAMQVHVELNEVEYALTRLEQGDYADAVRIFTGPFPESQGSRYHWRPSRYHGKALAQMALHQWEAALESIECAIDAHKLRHFPGNQRRSKREADWRKDAALVEIGHPCDIYALLWKVQAEILDALGRQEEAKQVRARAEQPVQQQHNDIYKRFHQRLEQWRLTRNMQDDMNR